MHEDNTALGYSCTASFTLAKLQPDHHLNHEMYIFIAMLTPLKTKYLFH